MPGRAAAELRRALRARDSRSVGYARVERAAARRRAGLLIGLLLPGCSTLIGLEQGQSSPASCTVSDECALGEVCSDAACAPACMEGERRCDMLTRKLCGADGTWSSLPCSNGCREGYCEEAKSCQLQPLCAAGASCCEVTAIEGGTFELPNDPDSLDGVGSVPRKVSPFALDRFEVTIGRFRRFILAFDALGPPRPGAGAHPNIPGSGWQSAWTERRELPQSASALRNMVEGCGQPTDGSLPEDAAVGCINWYVATAFCIWDGGRLPTESEWSYAAMAGDEQRIYPWSEKDIDIQIDSGHAYYHADQGQPAPAGPAAVGGRSEGRSKYGNEDMAGNVWEWTADVYRSALQKGPCRADVAQSEAQRDCEELDASGTRVQKGGSFVSSADALKNHTRGEAPADMRLPQYGFRCAHDLDETRRP